MGELANILKSNVARIVGRTSHAEIERQTGVGRNIISGILSGEGNPTLETLENLASGLKVSATDLITDPNAPTTCGRTPLEIKLVRILDTISKSVDEYRDSKGEKSRLSERGHK